MWKIKEIVIRKFEVEGLFFLFLKDWKDLTVYVVTGRSREKEVNNLERELITL